MYKELIIKAFQKAEELRIETGDKKPSLVNLSEDISDYIYDKEGFSLGERSFRDYRKDALKLIDSNDDINIKQLKVVIGLCKYLGFDSYQGFLSSLSLNENIEDIEVYSKKVNKKGLSHKLNLLNKKNVIIIVVSVISIITIIIITSINKQKWMVWDEDHYTEVKFDTDKYSIGELKLYKEERIVNFKKIIADCNTSFFNSDGSVKIWYSKNNKGELEYFTSIGLHPETTKTLKPISEYMIKKYICDDFDSN